MSKNILFLCLLGPLIGFGQETLTRGLSDFHRVQPEDLQDLRELKYESVLARVNAKNQRTKGEPDHLRDEILLGIHFAFEARIADSTSGVEGFGKWVSARGEEEVGRLKLGRSGKYLSETYFALAKLNAEIVRDPQAAKRLFLKGLQSWVENIAETTPSAELEPLLETLKGELRAALLKYVRLLKADEFEAQRQAGFELQRAMKTETANQEK